MDGNWNDSEFVQWLGRLIPSSICPRCGEQPVDLDDCPFCIDMDGGDVAAWYERNQTADGVIDILKGVR